jgi:hypothetical protein
MKLLNTKSSPVWQGIIADNENWFSKATLAFFGSTILWSSLKETERGLMFVSSEWNYNQSIKLFTTRLVTDNGIDTIGEFGQYETLGEALRSY